jgi:hypothetical protein
MGQRKLFFVSLLVVITIASAACSQSSGKGDLLGDEYISQNGGFSLRKPFGYLMQESGGVINFSAPDAQPEIGPMLMAMGGSTAMEMDNEALFAQTASSLTAMEFSKPKKVTINGVKGLQAEGQAEYDGETVEGQLFVAIVSPGQQFSLIGFAPKDRAKELVEIFDAVLNSALFTNNATASMEMTSETGTSMDAGPLRQWASSAYASSEYSSSDYSALRAVGMPDVDSCGDNVNAWASLGADSEEWLELSYDVPVVPTEINIYQSFNPSTVVEVQMVDTDGNTWVAWSGVPESVEKCPDQMTITLELDKDIYVNQVVVFIDQSVMGWGWTEIDAVELVGYPSGQTSAGVGAQQPSEASQTASAASGQYSADSLASGSFVYQVSGYENDYVENNSVSYNSTDTGYVVAMISGGNGRYAVNFIFPKQGMKNGRINLVPYNDADAAKYYMGMIYINAFPYKANEGWIDNQSDPAAAMLTGTFSFTAQSSDFPDRSVTVEGAMKDIPLK